MTILTPHMSGFYGYVALRALPRSDFSAMTAGLCDVMLVLKVNGGTNHSVRIDQVQLCEVALRERAHNV
jgi:hypothetical protein